MIRYYFLLIRKNLLVALMWPVAGRAHQCLGRVPKGPRTLDRQISLFLTRSHALCFRQTKIAICDMHKFEYSEV